MCPVRAKLDITPKDRNKILEEITYSDFYKGPEKDKLNEGPDMWIFKKSVKAREIYIKITLGLCGRNVVCISFHV
jgi:hypothetical protein